MKILCVFGKNDYGIESRGEGYEYRNFIPALKKLGHDVIHFDSWDRNLYSDFAELNIALLDLIEKEEPDIAIFVPILYEIWLETLDIISKYTNLKTICWCADDSWKYRQVSRFIGGSYHLMVTTYANVLPNYCRDNIKNVFLSQWAADSSNYIRPVESKNCEFDVVFIGSAHGNRKKKVKYLQSLGFNLTVYGSGWPNGPVSGGDISKIVNNSKITLNFSNSNGANQLKARIFEVPGFGGFLITEKTPCISKYFQAGNDIIEVESIQEMAININYYLNNPIERDKIAISGYHRIVQDHSYEKRFSKILEHISLIYPSPSKNIVVGLKTKLKPFCDEHKLTKNEKILQKLLKLIVIPGVPEGRKNIILRRLVFEIHWRLKKNEVFRAKGIAGKLFYI